MDRVIELLALVLVVSAWSVLAFRAFQRSGARKGKGILLHHSLLVRATGWAAIIPGLALAALVASTARGQDLAWGLGVSAAFLAAGTWLVLLSGSTYQLSHDGITRIGLFRTRTLRWSDVESVQFHVLAKAFRLRGAGRRAMWISITLVGGADFLRLLKTRLAPEITAEAMRDYGAFRERIGMQ